MLFIRQSLFSQESRDGQDAGRRIASRIGHELCVADPVSPQLRQTVDLPADELRRSMLRFIPFLVDRRIVQTKIRAEIHDLSALFHSDLRDFKDQTVGQRRKDNVHIADSGFRFLCAQQLLIQNPVKLRIDIGKRLTRIRIGRNKGHFRLRMID